jgi:hypothetical protein
MESKLNGTGAVAPLLEVGLELSPPELLVGELIGPSPSPTDARFGDVLLQYEAFGLSTDSNGERDRRIPKPETESV